MFSRNDSINPSSGVRIDTVGTKNNVIGINLNAISDFISFSIPESTIKNIRPRNTSTPVHRAPKSTCI